MHEPKFLTLSHVIRIHDDMIAEYGGTAGILNCGALESAVAMPQQSFGGEFLHSSLPEMAAAYSFHIIMGHCFIDGNKRTGMASGSIFILMNEHTFTQALDPSVAVSIAKHEISKEELAALYAANIEPFKLNID